MRRSVGSGHGSWGVRWRADAVAVCEQEDGYAEVGRRNKCGSAAPSVSGVDAAQDRRIRSEDSRAGKKPWGVARDGEPCWGNGRAIARRTMQWMLKAIPAAAWAVHMQGVTITPIAVLHRTPTPLFTYAVTYHANSLDGIHR